MSLPLNRKGGGALRARFRLILQTNSEFTVISQAAAYSTAP